jgi:nuclear transport factor 2 (NTF2) superfamily protein
MNTSTIGYVPNGTSTTAIPVVTYLSTTASTLTLNTNKMTVTQTKVAVFELIRNEKNEITDTKFIKELWVQTKNGSSLDFQVAKDAEIAKYDPQSISIRSIYTLNF